MKLPFIDKIWRVRGSLTLTPEQASGDIFARLDELFQQPGTRFAIEGDTLTFSKKAPLAQDRMSVFYNGNLQVQRSQDGTVLSYDMFSKTLLFCFTLPFFFTAVALLVPGAETSGWVFTGMFAALYVAGRILEPWLIRREFNKLLLNETPVETAQPVH